MILPLERIGKDGSVHKVEEFMEQGPMPTVPFFQVNALQHVKQMEATPLQLPNQILVALKPK